jgi:ribokinase
MQAVRFVAVGELLVDVVAAGAGHDARISVRPGGSAFNAAATAAAAGAAAAVIGTVGDDPAGRMVVAELEARGVRAEVTVSRKPTGVFLVDEAGIRVDRRASHELVLPNRIEGDAVLVSGYLPAATIESALARARAPWRALDAARLDSLPAGANALLANEEAARRLTGEEPEQAARELAERRRLACVTRGRLGAVAVLDGRLETMVPETAVAADGPGAGDAFAAALLVALAGGAGLADALADASRWGARAAALESPA